MALKKIKEGCWVDEDDQYFSLNEWFNIDIKKVIYYITDGNGYFEFKFDQPIAEEELYERVFLPGKNAVSAIFN